MITIDTCHHRAQRGATALLLLVALLAIGSSPIWHHEHDLEHSLRSGATGPETDAHHLCRAGGHSGAPIGRCPICLTQRLLSQSQIETANDPAIERSFIALTSRDGSPKAIQLPLSARPRAPPIL